MTQEAAAEKIGCSVQALQRMERAAAAVTIDFIARVAAGYRIDVVELLAAAGAWTAPVPGRPRRADNVIALPVARSAEPRSRWVRGRRKR